MQRIFLTLAISLMTVVISSTAYADETIQLLDNTKIIGTILHYYDGVLSIKLPNGNTVQIPSQKVRQILFKMPTPRAELSTPQKTFDRLRKAALKGDIATYVDCHSSYYQMFLNHQVSMTKPEEFVGRLKKEWGTINLEVTNTQIQGDTAIMKVKRKNAGEAQEGELRFVKENSEWKMILPL